MDKIDKYAELFIATAELHGFTDIDYHRYSDNTGGEICLKYDRAGFSVQLYKEGEDTVIDLALTSLRIDNIELYDNDITHFRFDRTAMFSDFCSVEEAVQDTILEIMSCSVQDTYAKIIQRINNAKNSLSSEEFEEFVKLVKEFY